MASTSSLSPDITLVIFTSAECDLDYLEFIEFLKEKLRLRDNELCGIKSLHFEHVDGENMFYVGFKDRRLIEDLKQIYRTEGSSKFLKHRNKKIYVTAPPQSTATLKKVNCLKEAKVVKLFHKHMNLLEVVKLITDDYGGIIHEKINGIVHYNDRSFIQCNKIDSANTLLNIFTNRRMKCIIAYESTEITFLPQEVRKLTEESSKPEKKTHEKGIKSIKDRLGKPAAAPTEIYRKRKANDEIDSDSDTPSVFLHRPKRTTIKSDKQFPVRPAEAATANNKIDSSNAANTTLLNESKNITSIQMFTIGVLDTTALPPGKWKIIAMKED